MVRDISEMKEKEERDGIIWVDPAKIKPHPDNPRKNLGDISELSDSIAQNGLMQNLTLVPGEKEGEYMCLIGHRRCAAAKLAGIQKVPAVVKTGLSLREQVSIMLEENMQRSDLTIMEQADGFQMMLDLGETVQTITEKTGFSESTVYHRLNIAKLDKKVLKEKMEDEGFQLSLKDLFALEKIKDVKKRNELLNNCRNSNNLRWAIENAVEEEKKREVMEKIEELLAEQGIQKADKRVEEEKWSNKWETVKEIPLDKVPKEIEVKGAKNGMLKGKKLFFVMFRYSGNISVITAKEKEEKKKSKEELEREQRDQRVKKIRAILKNQHKGREEYLRVIADAKVAPPKDDVKTLSRLWRMLQKDGGNIDEWVAKDLLFMDDWRTDKEEEKRVEEEIQMLPVSFLMLLAGIEDLETVHTVYWDGTYRKDPAEMLKRWDEELEKLGFQLDPEYIEVRDGTSELYEKGEEEAKV